MVSGSSRPRRSLDEMFGEEAKRMRLEQPDLFEIEAEFQDTDEWVRTPKVVVDREKERRALARLYGDLPPLQPVPPRVPLPQYIVDGRRQYSTDDSSCAFYEACGAGELDGVKEYAEDREPPPPVGELQYGLEKAAQNHQVDVARYLLQERHVPLHACVFTGIFDHDGPGSKLFELLAVLLDSGWHPDQSWEHPSWDPDTGLLVSTFPSSRRSFNPQIRRALGKRACLRDPAITKLLLERGADPTRRPVPLNPLGDQNPSRCRTNAVLNQAARLGQQETIDLLLAHGAKLESACLLHMVARRCGFEERFMDESLSWFGPPAQNKTPDARFHFAEYVLGLGEDIDAMRDVGEVIDHVRPLRNYEATALSHAVGYRDWEFVEWLLGRGADPNAHRGLAFRQLNGDGCSTEHYRQVLEDKTGPGTTKLLELIARGNKQKSLKQKSLDR